MPTSFDAAHKTRPRKCLVTVPHTGRAASLDATRRESNHSFPRLQPRQSTVGIGPASFLDADKPLEDHARIDESCLQQGCNEVAILLPERAELGNTEIFLVQTPTG